MMVTITTAALVLPLLVSICAAIPHVPPRVQKQQRERALRQEFVAAMEGEIEDDERVERRRRLDLQQRLLSLARRVDSKPRDESLPEFMTVNTRTRRRELYDNAYYYDDAFYNYNNDDGQQYGNGYNANYRAGFDLTNMALKYVGCQNIHTWQDWQDDGNNNNNGGDDYGSHSPLGMQRFVVFRLCEADTCSAYNKWGCNYHYGEYMLPMEDYLQIMTEYHTTQFQRYCQTCHACMTFEDTVKYGDDTTDDGTTDDNAANYDDAYHNQWYNNNDDDAAAGGNAGYYANSNYNGYDFYYNYNGANGNDDNNNNAGAYYGGDDAYGGGRRNLQYYGGYGYNNNNNGYGYNSNYNQYNQYGYNSNNGGGQYARYSNGNWYNQQGYRMYGYSPYPWYIDGNGDCRYQTVCNNYRKACKAYRGNATLYEDFFSCTALNGGNNGNDDNNQNQNGGFAVYLGPHCRSDGHTIGIGMYSDDTCSNYVGDAADAADYTQQTFDDAELQNYYDTDCISCNAEQAFGLISDSDYGATSDGSPPGNPLCPALYDASAKCNIHMAESYSGVDQDGNEYWSVGSAVQEENEETVCTFIESLIKNNYDDFGDVIVLDDFDYHNWRSGREYVKLVRKASPFQIFALIVSICTTLALFFYACYLHKKLLFRKPWVPPTKLASGRTWNPPGISPVESDMRSEAGRLSRAQSGIMAMRSRSIESSAAPYIPYGGSIPSKGSMGSSHQGFVPPSLSTRPSGSSDRPPLIPNKNSDIRQNRSPPSPQASQEGAGGGPSSPPSPADQEGGVLA